jgi:hypothetical protein
MGGVLEPLNMDNSKTENRAAGRPSGKQQRQRIDLPDEGEQLLAMTDLTVGISDPVTWGEPEQVNPKNVLVEGDRLPVDEDIVTALMATINTGNGKVLPPIHLWEKQPGSDLILVAGRNRLEAHKRSEHWISARIIRGDSPEIVRAVKLCEIEENLNRRKLSPALRKMYTAQLKMFYEEQHPETKAGKAGGLGKARKSAVPKSGTAPAFTKAHAKRTGRSPSAVAQDAAEAKTLGDETLQRIAGTSLDTPSEIAALAAMDEQERQQIIERAVAGETVSALKPERMSEESKTTTSFGMSAYKLASGLAAVPTAVLQNKLNKAVQRRADLPAKERRFLADALRAVAKRFEQIADKIDIDEPPEMAYTRQAVEALRLAHENKLAPIDPKEVIRAANAEITETYVEAARMVAGAWGFVAKQLERLRSDRGPDAARG